MITMPLMYLKLTREGFWEGIHEPGNVRSNRKLKYYMATFQNIAAKVLISFKVNTLCSMINHVWILLVVTRISCQLPSLGIPETFCKTSSTKSSSNPLLLVLFGTETLWCCLPSCLVFFILCCLSWLNHFTRFLLWHLSNSATTSNTIGHLGRHLWF